MGQFHALLVVINEQLRQEIAQNSPQNIHLYPNHSSKGSLFLREPIGCDLCGHIEKEWTPKRQDQLASKEKVKVVIDEQAYEDT